MKRVMVSFLGRGNYHEIRYRLNDDLVADRQIFSQVAICKLLSSVDRKIDKVIIFLTKEAEDNWKKLRPQLEALASPAIESVNIPNGKNEKEMWDIFNQIGAKFKTETQGNDDVKLIIDITYGFRALPVTLILALLFYKNIYGFNIESVYYGAFDAKEIKDGEEIAPIFDLTPMVGLAEWSESLVEWKQTGRGDILTKKMLNLQKDLKRQKMSKLPFEEVIISLNLLNAASDVLKVEDVFCQSVDARNKMAIFREEANKILTEFPMMSPVNEVIEYIQDDTLSFKGIMEEDFGIIGKPAEYQLDLISKNTLLNMISLAEWYLIRRRLIETFSVLRETLAICAAYIIAKKIGLDEISLNPNRKYFWDDCFSAVRSVCYPVRYPDPGNVFENNEIKSVVISKLIKWFDDRPNVRELFKELEDKVGKKRNSIDHCFIGSSEKLNWQEPLKDYIDSAGEYIDKVRQLVDLIDE